MGNSYLPHPHLHHTHRFLTVFLVSMQPTTTILFCSNNHTLSLIFWRVFTLFLFLSRFSPSSSPSLPCFPSCLYSNNLTSTHLPLSPLQDGILRVLMFVGTVVHCIPFQELSALSLLLQEVGVVVVFHVSFLISPSPDPRQPAPSFHNRCFGVPNSL